MDKPALRPEVQFSQPVRQVLLMLVVLALVGAGVYLAAAAIMPVFLANPFLNGAILLVFVVGVLACFWQVALLITSVRWIERFAIDRNDLFQTQAPRLLTPLAALLRSRGATKQISSASNRSILDSVATRIDEAREITRYIVSLLIFLGLLGTFYGLATTVPALVDTIRSLAPKDGESGVQVFSRLIGGLDQQLSGMGVAFSSSLLGLAGSLVVGLLELFAGHGQNRFYRELEDWLSTITRVGFSGGDGDDQSVAAQVMDHLVDQLQSMQEMFTQGEAGRAKLENSLTRLATGFETLMQRMERADEGQRALLQVAEGQERLIAALEKMEMGEALDPESRMRLRSIDVQMLRILEEIAAGRQETTAELRTDIADLRRSLAQLVKVATGAGSAPRDGGH